LTDDYFFFLLLAVPLSLTGLVASCSTISAGHVGVVTHFGAVQPYVLSEGATFTRPWPFADVMVPLLQLK
jgi:regulator of protease activity HflC (stomatin/prohibitin superfamily)